MRRITWAVALFLLAARAGMADNIALSNGAAVTGTVLHLTTNSILLLQEDGKTKTLARDTVKSFTLDFRAGDRRARCTTADGHSSLLVLSSFENLRFAGRDAEGKPATLPLTDTREAVLYPAMKPRHILDVPYVRQKPDFCGEACVEMLSTFLDRPVSQDKVNELAGLGGKRGCHAEELVAVLNKLDLKIASDDGWPGRTPDDFLAERMRLLSCLQKNHPVLLGLWGRHQAQQPGTTFDHIVLLIGYDLDRERLIIHDPGRWADWEVTFTDFIKHRQNSSGQLSQIEFALFRNWKTLDGTEISAALLEMNEQTLRLKPAKGDAITFSIDKLDPSGRAFVEKLRAGQSAPPQEAASARRTDVSGSDALYAGAREYALQGDKAEAIALLNRAVAAGFINFALLQNDKALDPIREEKLFKELLANKDKSLAEFITNTTAAFLKQLGDGYKVVTPTNSPYVVIGDANPANLKVVDDVLNVVSGLLGRTLFTNKPTSSFIVVIASDMQDFTQKLGGKPTSAGFYNQANRTLTIRRGTGTGTIVHEFTHALHFTDMEARGQIHPSWVREGFGSLYEESDPRADHLEGLVNWRLPILKKALQTGKAFPLRALMEDSRRCFTANVDIAYAMSRYLLFFLQSKQLLFPWYARYCDDYAADPTGIKTLEKVYGKPLDEFEKDWIEFVQMLK